MIITVKKISQIIERYSFLAETPYAYVKVYKKIIKIADIF